MRCFDKTNIERFLPDIWQNMTEKQKATGHGGMDGIMFRTWIA